MEKVVAVPLERLCELHAAQFIISSFIAIVEFSRQASTIQRNRSLRRINKLALMPTCYQGLPLPWPLQSAMHVCQWRPVLLTNEMIRRYRSHLKSWESAELPTELIAPNDYLQTSSITTVFHSSHLHTDPLPPSLTAICAIKHQVTCTGMRGHRICNRVSCIHARIPLIHCLKKRAHLETLCNFVKS